MRVVPLLLLAACTREMRPTRTATFPPRPAPIASYAPVVLQPGYAGDDADFSKLPPAPVTHVVSMRNGGGAHTTFRYDAHRLVFTAWNDGVERWLEAEWDGTSGCMMPAKPIHRKRALTDGEWRRLVWLVNLAEIERVRPPPEANYNQLARAMSGAAWIATFSLSSPEGDVSVSVAGPDVDGLRYAADYMRELAGDEF